MRVTINVPELHMDIHLTRERATLVQHAGGVPYGTAEEYPLGEFIERLRAAGRRSPARDGEGRGEG